MKLLEGTVEFVWIGLIGRCMGWFAKSTAVQLNFKLGVVEFGSHSIEGSLLSKVVFQQR